MNTNAGKSKQNVNHHKPFPILLSVGQGASTGYAHAITWSTPGQSGNTPSLFGFNCKLFNRRWLVHFGADVTFWNALSNSRGHRLGLRRDIDSTASQKTFLHCRRDIGRAKEAFKPQPSQGCFALGWSFSIMRTVIIGKAIYFFQFSTSINPALIDGFLQPLLVLQMRIGPGRETKATSQYRETEWLW